MSGLISFLLLLLFMWFFHKKGSAPYWQLVEKYGVRKSAHANLERFQLIRFENYSLSNLCKVAIDDRGIYVEPSWFWMKPLFLPYDKMSFAPATVEYLESNVKMDGVPAVRIAFGAEYDDLLESRCRKRTGGE